MKKNYSSESGLSVNLHRMKLPRIGIAERILYDYQFCTQFFTASELAQKYDCSRCAVYRALKTLRRKWGTNVYDEHEQVGEDGHLYRCNDPQQAIHGGFENATPEQVAAWNVVRQIVGRQLRKLGIVKGERVRSKSACPQCGERDSDNLIWSDDDRIQCMTCGMVYEIADDGDL